MGCTTCKQKGKIKEELITSTKFIGKVVIWFTVIWTVLGVYGLITLIGKLL